MRLAASPEEAVEGSEAGREAWGSGGPRLRGQSDLGRGGAGGMGREDSGAGARAVGGMRGWLWLVPTILRDQRRKEEKASELAKTRRGYAVG